MSYNLTDRRTVKALLAAHGKELTKALGQNFLIDGEVPPRIAQASGITEDCGVLEIGPGIGCLTVELARAASKVVAVEIDGSLLPLLKETLAGFQNITVVNDDVLKLDLHQLVEQEFPKMEVHVCANLPYYITTPILMKLLESRLPVRKITVMVQKEVARRLCAPPGGKEYGAITPVVHYYAIPQILFEVPADSFFPAPKVDSAVVSLEIREKPPVSAEEAKLFAVIRAAFSQRRTTLANCLMASGLFKGEKQRLETLLEELGLSRTVRGETLGLEQFAQLSEVLSRETGGAEVLR